MNWKGCGRKQSWPNLRDPDICVEGLREVTKHLKISGRRGKIGPRVLLNAKENSGTIDCDARFNIRN
jgi:hypothetical protein